MYKGNMRKQAIAVIFIVFCGCTPKERSSPVFRHSATVSVHPVKNPPFIGLPVALEYYDGRVYISDFHGDTLVVEFDVENFRVVSKSIIKGTGPGDALPPLGLFLSDDTLFLLNRRTFNLGYDIPNVSGEHRGLTFNKLCSFPVEISNLTAIDGRYLAAGYFNGGRYAVFNSRGEKEQEFGDYPSFLAGEKDFPIPAKAMYH
jgi:outer membrane protein assembly factor BamB